MKRIFMLIGWNVAIILGMLQAPRLNAAEALKPVRVAVIGGMTMTPLWSEIQKRFEADTGIKIQVVATGEKPVLAKAMKEGKVDFLNILLIRRNAPSSKILKG